MSHSAPTPAVNVPWRLAGSALLPADSPLAPREMGQIYEVIRVHRGSPWFLREHMARMANSARQLGIPMPDKSEWQEALQTLCAKQTGTQNLELRLEKLEKRGWQLIGQFIPSRYPSASDYERGVEVGILDGVRPQPHAKQAGHPIRKMAEEALKKTGFYEMLLRNPQGEITEGSRSNLLFLSDGKLFTPPIASVLPGITLQAVQRAAKSLNLTIAESPISYDLLPSFSAAAILGTSPGVLPIRTIYAPNMPEEEQPSPCAEFDPSNPTLQSLRKAYEAIAIKG